VVRMRHEQLKFRPILKTNHDCMRESGRIWVPTHAHAGRKNAENPVESRFALPIKSLESLFRDGLPQFHANQMFNRHTRVV